MIHVLFLLLLSMVTDAPTKQRSKKKLLIGGSLLAGAAVIGGAFFLAGAGESIYLPHNYAGNTVYINDSRIYWSFTPHNATVEDNIAQNITIKNFTGEVAVIYLFNSSDTGLPSNARILRNITVERSLSCDPGVPGQWYNYSIAQKRVWCWQNYTTPTQNMTLLWTRTYDRANLSANTIYWNDTELQPRNIGGLFDQISVDIAGYDTGYMIRANVTANSTYQLLFRLEAPPGSSGKYAACQWPSSVYGYSLAGLHNALTAGNAYCIDPTWSKGPNLTSLANVTRFYDSADAGTAAGNNWSAGSYSGGRFDSGAVGSYANTHNNLTTTAPWTYPIILSGNTIRSGADTGAMGLGNSTSGVGPSVVFEGSTNKLYCANGAGTQVGSNLGLTTVQANWSLEMQNSTHLKCIVNGTTLYDGVLPAYGLRDRINGYNGGGTSVSWDNISLIVTSTSSTSAGNFTPLYQLPILIAWNSTQNNSPSVVTNKSIMIMVHNATFNNSAEPSFGDVRVKTVNASNNDTVDVPFNLTFINATHANITINVSTNSSSMFNGNGTNSTRYFLVWGNNTGGNTTSRPMGANFTSAPTNWTVEAICSYREGPCPAPIATPTGINWSAQVSNLTANHNATLYPYRNITPTDDYSQFNKDIQVITGVYNQSTGRIDFNGSGVADKTWTRMNFSGTAFTLAFKYVPKSNVASAEIIGNGIVTGSPFKQWNVRHGAGAPSQMLFCMTNTTDSSCVGTIVTTIVPTTEYCLLITYNGTQVSQYAGINGSAPTLVGTQTKPNLNATYVANFSIGSTTVNGSIGPVGLYARVFNLTQAVEWCNGTHLLTEVQAEYRFLNTTLNTSGLVLYDLNATNTSNACFVRIQSYTTNSTLVDKIHEFNDGSLSGGVNFSNDGWNGSKAYNFTPNANNKRINFGTRSSFPYDINDTAFGIIAFATRHDTTSNSESVIVSTDRSNAGCSGGYGSGCGGFSVDIRLGQFIFFADISNTSTGAAAGIAVAYIASVNQSTTGHWYAVTHNGTRGAPPKMYYDSSTPITTTCTNSACANWTLGTEEWGRRDTLAQYTIGDVAQHSGGGLNGSVSHYFYFWGREPSAEEIDFIITHGYPMKNSNLIIGVISADDEYHNVSVAYDRDFVCQNCSWFDNRTAEFYIAPNGNISRTGVYDVNFTATDNCSNTITQTITLNITNTAPDAGIPAISCPDAYEGASCTLYCKVSDPDGDVLNVTWNMTRNSTAFLSGLNASQVSGTNLTLGNLTAQATYAYQLNCSANDTLLAGATGSANKSTVSGYPQEARCANMSDLLWVANISRGTFTPATNNYTEHNITPVNLSACNYAWILNNTAPFALNYTFSSNISIAQAYLTVNGSRINITTNKTITVPAGVAYLVNTSLNLSSINISALNRLNITVNVTEGR